MNPTQQSHTLPSRTSQSSNQSLAKSVSATALQKSKSNPSKNFKNATHNRHKNSGSATAKPFTENGLTMTKDRRPAYNSVLPQLALTCKIEAECSYHTFV